MTSLRCIVFVIVIGVVIGLRADDSAPIQPIPPVCVILIGGIDSDPSPEQISGTARRGQGQSGMYQLANDLTRLGLNAEYFNWNGSRAGKIREKPPLASGIAQYIKDRHTRQPSEQFAIIANSWGGHTAWEACQSLAEPEVPIELTVFLDPSSLGRAKAARPKQLPSCIKTARNYYTRNVFGWREWPNETRLVNVDLGEEKHGFLVPGGPRYDAAFDTQAHIAAEWDPLIHQEIIRQVVTTFKYDTVWREKTARLP